MPALRTVRGSIKTRTLSHELAIFSKGGHQRKESAVAVTDDPTGAHIRAGDTQAGGFHHPALAAIGQFINSFLECRGVDRATFLRAGRIHHNGGDRLWGQALGCVLPGHSEIGAQAHAARKSGTVVASGDAVVVGNIVKISKGAPDFPRRLRIESQLVSRVAQRPAGLPIPSLAGVGRAGKTDVRISDVVPVGLEGIEVIIPNGGHHQPGVDPAHPLAAASRLLGAARVGSLPSLPAIAGDVALHPIGDDHMIRVGGVDAEARSVIAPTAALIDQVVGANVEPGRFH